MKRKKLVLSTALIFLVLIILSFLYFYYFHYSFRLIEESKYLTNTSELYSRFTPYLQDVVNFRLKAIGCSPSKYYYENKSICFVCGEVNACFKYAIVNRGDEGIKMNYIGFAELQGKFSENDALSFYSFGISKLLNCQSNLVCERNIIASINGTLVKFIFPSPEIIDEVIIELTKKLNITDECERDYSNTKILGCGKFRVLWYSDNIVGFDLI